MATYRLQITHIFSSFAIIYRVKCECVYLKFRRTLRTAPIASRIADESDVWIDEFEHDQRMAALYIFTRIRGHLDGIVDSISRRRGFRDTYSAWQICEIETISRVNYTKKKWQNHNDEYGLMRAINAGRDFLTALRTDRIIGIVADISQSLYIFG